MAAVVTDVDAGSGIPISGGLAGYKQVVKDFTFDNSYPTGGLACTPAMFGFASFLYVSAEPKGGRVFSMDYVNSKLQAYQDAGAAAALAEVPNATNLSTVTTRVTAIGVPA